MKWYGIVKISFPNTNLLVENSQEDQWKFRNIYEIVHHRDYMQIGSLEGPLFNSGSAITEIILWVEIFNFKKSIFNNKYTISQEAIWEYKISSELKLFKAACAKVSNILKWL